MNLIDHIRTIKDFPSPGILFYDISTLLLDPAAWRTTINMMIERVRPYKPDIIAAVDARGFLAASPLALELGVGLLMIRKKGKLPGKTIEYSYVKEYGTDVLEIPADLLRPGQQVFIVDDLLATGGTLIAALGLLRKAGGEVTGAACIMELASLGARAKVDVPVETLLSL